VAVIYLISILWNYLKVEVLSGSLIYSVPRKSARNICTNSNGKMVFSALNAIILTVGKVNVIRRFVKIADMWNRLPQIRFFTRSGLGCVRPSLFYLRCPLRLKVVLPPCWQQNMTSPKKLPGCLCRKLERQWT